MFPLIISLLLAGLRGNEVELRMDYFEKKGSTIIKFRLFYGLSTFCSAFIDLSTNYDQCYPGSWTLVLLFRTKDNSIKEQVIDLDCDKSPKVLMKMSRIYNASCWVSGRDQADDFLRTKNPKIERYVEDFVDLIAGRKFKREGKGYFVIYFLMENQEQELGFKAFVESKGNNVRHNVEF